MTTTEKTTRTSLTWLTTQEMAARIHLHERTLLRLASDRKVPYLRAGRALRFDPEAVEAALTTQAVND